MLRSIESRIVLGLMPDSSSSFSFICEWVVLAGWITRDLTSATFASSEKISSLSIKALAPQPAFISKVKMEPPPLESISDRANDTGFPAERGGDL